MKASNLAVDPAAIEAGEWVGDIPDCDDLRIKTRGAGNADWRRVWNRELAKLPRAEKRGQATPESADRITIACIVEAGLLDWENLIGDDGAPIPVSAAKDMLPNPKWRNLLGACLFAANKVASTTDADRADAEKN